MNIEKTPAVDNFRISHLQHELHEVNTILLGHEKDANKFPASLPPDELLPFASFSIDILSESNRIKKTYETNAMIEYTLAFIFIPSADMAIMKMPYGTVRHLMPANLFKSHASFIPSYREVSNWDHADLQGT